MPYKIEIRDASMQWKTLRRIFDTYRSAVLCGQDLAPHNFSVITPMNRVPSREEQLLQPLSKRKYKSLPSAARDFINSI